MLQGELTMPRCFGTDTFQTLQDLRRHRQHAGAHLVANGLKDSQVQALLATEVVADQGLVDTCGIRDGSGTGGCIADLAKRVRSCVDQGFPGLVTSALYSDLSHKTYFSQSINLVK